MYGSDETLLDGDQRRKIWYSKDDHTGLITLRTEFNNDTGMALAAEKRKNSDKSWKGTAEGDKHLFAHIPDSIVMLELVPLGICAPGGRVLDMKALLKWLDKSDNKVFKTKDARHVL